MEVVCDDGQAGVDAARSDIPEKLQDLIRTEVAVPSRFAHLQIRNWNPIDSVIVTLRCPRFRLAPCLH